MTSIENIKSKRSYTSHSIGLRARVIALWQDGQSQRSIAKTLCISPATVQSIEEKFKKVENLENQPGRGRKRKTTARQDRSLIKKDSKLIQDLQQQ